MAGWNERDPLPSASARGDAEIARARVQARAVAHLVILAVAVLFIGSSAVQLVVAVFRLGSPESDALAPSVGGTTNGPSSATAECAARVRVLARALDRAGASALASKPAADGVDGQASDFRLALSPEWDDAARARDACASTSGGLDAWAALSRLRVAEEQLAQRDHEDLTPLREDLIAHLQAGDR